MSKKKTKQVPRLTRQQAEEIKRAYEQAKKAGDPLAYVADRIATGEDTATLRGEPLRSHIVDTNIALDTGRYLPRDPDYMLDPAGRVLPISTTTEPALVTPDGLIVHPERQVKEWVKVDGLPCPNCGDEDTKEGWNLIAPHLEGGMMMEVQCSKCQKYIGLGHGKKEGADDEEK